MRASANGLRGHKFSVAASQGKPAGAGQGAAFQASQFVLERPSVGHRRTRWEIGMSVSQATRPRAFRQQANDTRALEAAAATRLLVEERILDYSGHVSIRVPGQDAFVIQIGSHSRAEVDPAAMLVVDFDG